VMVGRFETILYTDLIPSRLKIRSLIGLRPAVSPYLAAFSLPDLVKLIYRDYIPLKHGDRKRLAEELETMKPTLFEPCKRAAIQNQEEGDIDCAEQNLLSRMLVKYLREASQLY